MWRVEFASQAARVLRKLRGMERQRLIEAIDAIQAEPRPAGKHVKDLEGAAEPLLRYRDGERRSVYAVNEAKSVIVIRGNVDRKDLDTMMRGTQRREKNATTAS